MEDKEWFEKRKKSKHKPTYVKMYRNDNVIVDVPFNDVEEKFEKGWRLYRQELGFFPPSHGSAEYIRATRIRKLLIDNGFSPRDFGVSSAYLESGEVMINVYNYKKCRKIKRLLKNKRIPYIDYFKYTLLEIDVTTHEERKKFIKKYKEEPEYFIRHPSSIERIHEELFSDKDLNVDSYDILVYPNVKVSREYKKYIE